MTGTFRLIPSTLALIAVQRQSAASKSAKPSSNAQHWLEAGDPTTTLTSPRMSAQTPSFSVSVGHFPDAGAGAAGVVGVGVGVVGGVVQGALGGVLGFDLHEQQAWENVKE